MEIVALVATVVTIGLFSAGIKTSRDIHRSKSVGSVPHLPFIACFLNCALWLLYGCLKPDFAVIIPNAVGLVLQLFYIVVYHIYSDNKFAVKRDTAIATVIVIVVTLCFTKGNFMITLLHLGLVCNFFTILFFASPLATLADVIRKRSTESLSFLLSAMSALSCTTWILYGFMTADVFIVVPNAIGLILSLIQLLLFLMYQDVKRVISLNNSTL